MATKKQGCIGLCALVTVLMVVQAGPVGADLASLPFLRDAIAGRVSSYDVTGGNADSWDFESGQTREIARLEGPGAITHMWFTVAARGPGYYRKIVLRIYWDEEPTPSVEVPIGDFFGLGHGQYYLYSCAPIHIGDRGGLNCYWRMPFKKAARLTLTNECEQPLGVYFHVDWERWPGGEARFRRMGYFHAQYRQGRPPAPGKDYTILEATGHGTYVGCNFTIELGSPGWWGEGDDKIYIDGATTPTIWGTGSEDYFNGAWGFPSTAYANPYTGVPLNGFFKTGAITNCYRYHLEDPIPFQQSLRVDIEHRGGDYISTVAYWYQQEPHAPFPPLPALDDRLLEDQRNPYIEPEAADAEDYITEFAVEGAPTSILQVERLFGYKDKWSGNAQLLLKAEAPGVQMLLPTDGIPSLTAMTMWFTRGPKYGIFRIRLGDAVALESFDGYAPEVTRSEPVKVTFPKPTGSDNLIFEIVGKNEASKGYWLGLDCVRL